MTSVGDAAVVTATLHGGPRDGETLAMPWARIEIVLPHWADHSLDGEELYRLRGPWRGQPSADYYFVEPPPPPRQRSWFRRWLRKHLRRLLLVL